MQNPSRELVRAWKRWFRIIEAAARGSRIERQVSPDAYDAIHKELIRVCRLRGVDQYKYSALLAREIAGFAEKWDTLDKVIATDPSLLAREVDRARIQFAYRIRRRMSLTPKRLVKILVSLAVIAVIGIYIYDSSIIEDIPRHIRRGFRSFTRYAKNERESFYAITILAAVLSSMILYSTKKS